MCKSIFESQKHKTTNPFSGQAYKGNSGCKSGLKYWNDCGGNCNSEGGVCFQSVVDLVCGGF